MKVITAPEIIATNGYSVFLAGSIEEGEAENWQQKVIEGLSEDTVLTVLNPRRPKWEKVEQSMSNLQFATQVHWELDAMNAADMIVFYFQPGTKAPISLLELGLHATDMDKHVIVCCPEGFWRKGNVDIICQDYNIPQVNTLEELIEKIKTI
jgi:hypothetical protein